MLRFPLHTKLHLPVEDGRVVTGTSFTPDFPGWGGWMRLSCIAAELEGVTLQISLREAKKVFHRVWVERKDDELCLCLTWRQASFSPRKESTGPPELHLQEHKNVQEVWQDHRKWMDKIWPRQTTYTSGWVNKIPCAVYVEMWTGSGTITHTFSDLVGLMTTMYDAGIPENALLYFWGFHAPFDTNYPNYWPAEELGGEDGLMAVVETARNFGYRLMPHFNYWGCDPRLPVYQELQSEQVRNRYGVRQGWRVDGEPPIDYIRPGSRRWRDLMTTISQRFVDKFPVDAIFLDQLGFFVDDPGCDFDAATLQYILQLQAACPQVVLAGEIFHQRCRSLPLWQVWGTPWCGLPVQENLSHSTMWRDLFSDHMTMIAHMGMPAAVPVRDSWPAYYWYPGRYGIKKAAQRANKWHRAIGAVPCVRVNYQEYGLDDLAVRILKNQDS
jgi:hypothetical protein